MRLIVFLSFQVNCAASGCHAVFFGYGHMVCREHAPCKVRKPGNIIVWDPADCHICSKLVDSAFKSKDITRIDRKNAVNHLKKWIRGFQKNKTGPYLANDDLRETLFPKSGREAVWRADSTSEPQASTSKDLEKSLGIMDLDTEGMDVDKETEEDLLAEKSSGFDGFPDEEDEIDTSTVATPDTYSSPSPSRSAASNPSRSRHPSEQTGTIPKAKTTKPTEEVTDPIIKRFDNAAAQMEQMVQLLKEAQEGRKQAEQERDRARVQAEKAHFLAVEESQKKDIAVKEKIARLQEKAIEERKKFRQEIDELKKSRPDASGLPPMPPNLDHNPWRPGYLVTKTEGGYYTIGGTWGTRHEEDLVFSPNKDEYPRVWIRLRDEVVGKDDLVVKESVLFEHSKAQDTYSRIFRKVEAKTLGFGIDGKKTCIFNAPNDMVFPFASKAFHHMKAAWREDKGKFPALKEFDSVSLLCPQESLEDWGECALTFKGGRFEPDCAREQFGESVPFIPYKQLKDEFDKRLVLAHALGTQTMIELHIHRHPEMEGFKLLAKQHLPQFAKALFDFGEAKKTCRKTVLDRATIKHEPSRLIHSSIWGEYLFPVDVVREAKSLAEKAGKSLLDRWGMQESKKRKASDDGKQGNKRRKGNNPYNKTKKDEASFRSPAYNKKFEEQPGSSYNRKSNFKKRGGKGQHGGNNKPGKSPRDQGKGGRGGRGGRGGYKGKSSSRPSNSK